MSAHTLQPVQATALVAIDHLRRVFPLPQSGWDKLRGKAAAQIIAVDDLNLRIDRQTTVALVGESGAVLKRGHELGPVLAPGWAMRDADADLGLDLASHAGLEAQVAALADDIAYDNHDLDDGIRAGLFSVEDLVAAVPFSAASWAAVQARWPGVTARRRLVPELVRDQIGRMTDDLLGESRRRIAAAAPRSVAEVRAAGRPLAGFSPALAAETALLKAFLQARMYRHPHVAALRDPSKLVVAGLFAALHAEPAGMPAEWAAATPLAEPARARHIADFIAGMTDRYALKLYQQLVGTSPLPADIVI